jgi:Asp-tRNA(Asn)/Glu-tRNA(Gln) amidotransferase A subunit family amidase
LSRSAALRDNTAEQAAAAIARGAVTSEALVASCLERIGARDDDIKAWVALDPDMALAEARARDRESPRGSLHGVPVGVKDVIDTAQLPTAYGSEIYTGYRPHADAACVAMLREAGGIVLGKTSCTEFATRRPTATVNPHNTEHSPGGSSSGSAAAVADHMVPLAIGTQTGGSVIRPAAYCGVVGYLPSYNAINRAGMKFLSESLDTIGVFARTLGDAALLASVLAGSPRPRLDPATRPPRVGFCRTPFWSRADAATVTALQDGVTALKAAGADVTDVELPAPFGGLGDAQQTIMIFEMWRALAHERQVHPDLLSPQIRALLETGRDCTFERYLAAQNLGAACRTAFAVTFATVDVLIGPSATGEAPHGLADTGDPVFGQMWTVLHAPCVTLPLCRGPAGLPLGLQIVGPMGADNSVLRAAAWIERHLA